MATSKHSHVMKAEASSFSLRSVTFEEVLGDPTLGSKICIFDNWEVSKCIFENFIHHIDVEWVVKEGSRQCRRDAILSIMQLVSLPIFEYSFHHLLTHHQICYFIGMSLHQELLRSEGPVGGQEKVEEGVGCMLEGGESPPKDSEN